MTTTSMLRRSLAIGAALCAFSAPVAAANDLRSPDTRDVAAQQSGKAPWASGLQSTMTALTGRNDVRVSHVAIDRRSPDARDAAAGRALGQTQGTDLRSPDTRDIAAGRKPATTAPTPSGSHHDAPDIFLWALIAGLAALGCVALVRQGTRRRHGVIA